MFAKDEQHRSVIFYSCIGVLFDSSYIDKTGASRVITAVMKPRLCDIGVFSNAFDKAVVNEQPAGAEL